MNRVSVIIPVYQGERYLAEAVESVLAQTYPAAEIIIVNDGSTDGTEQVAARFGNAIRYVAQENSGIGAARNTGLEMTQFEWISFLDSDDLWSTDKLALQMQALETHPEPDLVFGYVRQFHDPALPPEIKARIYCPDQPQPGINAGTLLVRRDTFFRVGLFQTYYRVGEFLDWYLRAQEIGLMSLVLPQVVSHRRLHENNQGARERESRVDMLHILKASLNRRRGAFPSSEQ
jgi:glycosyltransferase involved in cell wall biosynthesis